jgi:hypothetical protein
VQIGRNSLDDFVGSPRAAQAPERIEERAEIVEELGAFLGFTLSHIVSMLRHRSS